MPFMSSHLLNTLVSCKRTEAVVNKWFLRGKRRIFKVSFGLKSNVSAVNNISWVAICNVSGFL